MIDAIHRSIDVDQPVDLESGYTIGSFCTGFGGLDLAVESVFGPARHLWHAEYDPSRDPQHPAYKQGNPTDPYWKTPVLKAHWPDVPNLGDIADVDWGVVPITDFVSARFSCTDISAAGRRAGMGVGTRSGVWSNIAHALGVLTQRARAQGRPAPIVVVENVRALLSTHAQRNADDPATADRDLEHGPADVGDGADRPVLRALGAVLGDLADLGFDAEWVTVPASAVGAPHRRERVFVLAWPADSEGVGHWHTRAQGRCGVPATPVTGGAGTDRLNLLPTPMARLGDARGAPSATVAADRMDSGRRNLDDAVALLPTPIARDGHGRGEGSATYWDGKRDRGWDKGLPLGAVVTLLPTPRATDGTKGGPNQRGSSGDLMLPSAVMELLPTPVATDARAARSATANRTVPKPSTSTTGWTLSDVAHADRWGRYAPAIHRREAVTGRPAPEPTEPGAKGQARLSPRFVEWLMGLPDGWVTDHVGRNAALGALGDGVVWRQAAHALRLLLDSAVTS